MRGGRVFGATGGPGSYLRTVLLGIGRVPRARLNSSLLGIGRVPRSCCGCEFLPIRHTALLLSGPGALHARVTRRTADVPMAWLRTLLSDVPRRACGARFRQRCCHRYRSHYYLHNSMVDTIITEAVGVF